MRREDVFWLTLSELSGHFHLALLVGPLAERYIPEGAHGGGGPFISQHLGMERDSKGPGSRHLLKAR